jgi:hypothetical protein
MDSISIMNVIDQTVDEVISQKLFLPSLMISISLVIALVALRFILIYFVKGKAEILDPEQRRWINRINNIISISIMVAILLVWAPQLQAFALSLTAVAVAVVLTTKELLMCLTGGFLRTWSKPFDVGDWITIDGVTGEVMTITALAVKIQEIDIAEQSYQFTGKTIQIPNSKFLSANVLNAEFNKHYIYHEVHIFVQPESLDPNMLMIKLTEISEKYFSTFREEAEIFNKNIEKKTAIDFESPYPKVFMKSTLEGRYLFIVKLLVPTQQLSAISSSITCDFISYFNLEKLKIPKNENHISD